MAVHASILTSEDGLFFNEQFIGARMPLPQKNYPLYQQHYDVSPNKLASWLSKESKLKD